MKKIHFLFLTVIFLFGFYELSADQIPGSQYFYLGNGISYFPLGASGVSYFMSMGSNLYNPAGYADIRRITTDISVGGLGGDNFLLNTRGSFPTSYGVITGNVLLLTSPEGESAGDVVGVKGTFSKAISEEWLFGAAVNLGFADGPDSDFIVSFDLGTIYKKERDGTGFGLFDYSLGAAVKNIGKNISYSGYDSFPPLAVDIGGRAEVFRKGIYKTRIGTHFEVPFNPPTAFFGAGVENIFFDMVNLKFGLNLGVEEIDPYSFGLDLNFALKDTDIQVSYSMLPIKFNGEREYTHNAGISVAFGSYDNKPPTASVGVEAASFSPNHDGVNDKARFPIDLKDNTMVFGWKLDITDESGKPVKSYTAQDVRKIRRMTLGKYVRRIFAKKKEVEIPKVIEWDGEDAEGTLVKDGVYSFSLSAWDENNNKIVTEKGRVVVDTVVPLVEAESDMFLFSPNGDGAKDTITFTIESADIAGDDQVVLQILNKDNNVVFEKRFEGSVPERYIWDGRDVAGATVQEGNYTFLLSATDAAGNRSKSVVEGIVVKTEYEKVSVSPALRTFSPNGDGYFDINDIKLFTSSKEGLIRWNLDIVDKDEKLVRQYEGIKDFPEVVSFDGKNSAGSLLPDGLYSIRVRLFYESGNHPESYYKFIGIDTSPPGVEVGSNYNAFSPNRDGVKDTVSFIHTITAKEGDSFEAKIVNSAGATFKSFRFGKNPPGVLVWDGMGDNNTQPVEGTYTYVFSGTDEVGNSVTKRVGPIRLTTGFEQVSIEPSVYIFSPNKDGRNDTVSFKLNTDNRQGLVEWRLDIKNIGGEVIQSFNDRNMGVDLPREIQWDGKTRLLPVAEDGRYSVSFSILYDTGNNPISKPKEVVLDTKPPKFELYTEDLFVSPNNDGSKETLVLYQRIEGGSEDAYTASIVDQRGRAVKRFSWKGAPPSEVVWDGRDENGKIVAEGDYVYVIKGEDAAGNRSEATLEGIRLVTSYEKVGVQANRKGISPNGDRLFDEVTFTPTSSSEKGLDEWRIDIFDSQDKKLREIRGKGKLPPTIVWDGKDQTGNIVPDGEYTYRFIVFYVSGNHPSTAPAPLIVDATPPRYGFVISPKLFSPDGNGEADTMYMNLELSDKNGVSDWELVIYRKWGEEVDRSKPFKRYSGKGEYKQTILWDGYSDPFSMPSSFTPPDEYTYRRVDGEWAMLVDSASTYIVELKARDIYQNRIEAERSFETDILLIKTPYGWKIMVNSIEFEFDKADLMPQSHGILDRLIQIIEKFPEYKINIVGHTDWVGADEYNQKLSEKRALSVYKYLVAHDVDKERLTTEGRGEKQPIDVNITETGRARNRRVEFYLTKKSKS